MTNDRYEIEYLNGEKEIIDLGRVCLFNKDYSGHSYGYGVGVSLDKFLEFLKDNKPIVVFKDRTSTDEDNIEKIINSHQIKFVRPVPLIPSYSSVVRSAENPMG